MKVKNITNKPIGIGILNLLPGATETLPKAYEKHPIVTMLAKKKFNEDHTFITLIDENKQPEDDSNSDESESNGNDSQESADGKTTYTLSQLKRLGKAKLEEMAKEAGIVVEDATVEKLADAIFAAQGADNGSEE